jgi:hypothetical protein
MILAWNANIANEKSLLLVVKTIFFGNDLSLLSFGKTQLGMPPAMTLQPLRNPFQKRYMRQLFLNPNIFL